MKTMKRWRIILMVLAALSLASCSNTKDGDWESMVWKTEIPGVRTTDGYYEVSADGGTFTFACRNYSSPWIEGAVSGDNYFFPPREANDYHTITADWFKAEIVGNKLTVTFETNETAQVRPLELTVTAGDIFYTFKFKQLQR